MHPSHAHPHRTTLALAGLWLAVLAAGPARAWQYPLLPHVNGLAFFPETPNTVSPVSAQLSAYYPNECWQLVDTVLVDSAHVQVTIERIGTCSDSLSGWTHAFDLGRLAAGMHDLTVHCTVVEPGQPDGEEEITVPFEVVNGGPPPPPGPPSALPLLEIIALPAVLPGEPDTLTLQGFKPFACTLIHDEHVQGQEAVYATFDRQTSCADTTRRWQRSFALGGFAEGDYTIAIHLLVNDSDSSYEVTSSAVAHVHAPAPPPPPVDSSVAGMSSSHPNPFRDQSSFSVSLDQAQAVDVAVFDLLGRRVTTIHHGVLPQGTSLLAWDGRRQDGGRAPGGIYFYRVTLPDRVIHRQVVLLGTP
jgi:hypothetical protein